MDCLNGSDRIQAFVDGELDTGEASGVEAHLALCVDCLAEAEAIRALYAAVADLPLPKDRLDEGEAERWVRKAVGVTTGKEVVMAFSASLAAAVLVAVGIGGLLAPAPKEPGSASPQGSEAPKGPATKMKMRGTIQAPISKGPDAEACWASMTPEAVLWKSDLVLVADIEGCDIERNASGEPEALKARLTVVEILKGEPTREEIKKGEIEIRMPPVLARGSSVEFDVERALKKGRAVLYLLRNKDGGYSLGNHPDMRPQYDWEKAKVQTLEILKKHAEKK